MSKTKKSIEYIVPEQIEEIEYTVRNHPDLLEVMMKQKGIASLAEIKKEDYRNIIERLRQIAQYKDSFVVTNYDKK